MTVIRCVCGHDNAEHKGVLRCGHCDADCRVNVYACRWCRAYNAHTNARVNDEHETERRKKAADGGS